MVLVVIPARMGSTRLPCKPLADMCGAPLVVRVWERALRIRRAEAVLVAVDDPRVLAAVEKAGGRAVLTSVGHPTGGDRAAEVASRFPASLYVNVQGDEPFFDPEAVDALIAFMQADPARLVGTLCRPLAGDEADSPNVVKVVRDESGRALYFSRSPIPHAPPGETVRRFGHIGVYAYRPQALARFAASLQPEMESAERLEQLRFLHLGLAVHCLEWTNQPGGVDVPEDLERARAVFQANADALARSR